MKIYLDFDGTVVEHAFPKMGRCNFGCMEVIKKLQDAGHDVILNTFRADIGESALREALDLLHFQAWSFTKDANEDFEFLPPITALPAKKHPARWDWQLMEMTGEIYIDDIATDMPLKNAVMTSGKMVDWGFIDLEFIEHGIY